MSLNSKNPHSHTKNPPPLYIYALGALLGFIVVVRLISLALYPLMDPTEARYAEMARKILELDDWVVLHFTYEQPFWGKPPLSFWGSAVGMWIFGINEFGARIVPFVASLLVCALFFAWDFGDKINSANFAHNAKGDSKADLQSDSRKKIILLPLASGIIFYSCAIGFVGAGAVMTDEFLLLCVGLCMVGFWRCVCDSKNCGGGNASANQTRDFSSVNRAIDSSDSNITAKLAIDSNDSHDSSDSNSPNPKSTRIKRLWGYAFFVGIGLGLLAKGPLIFVLVGVPLMGFIALVWGFRHFHKNANLRLDFSCFPLFSGGLLALIIALPWYVLCEMRSEGFLEYFIVGEHFKRFLISGWEGDLYGSAHSRTLGSIWVFFLVAFLPWSVVFVGFLCAFLAKIFRRDSKSAHLDLPLDSRQNRQNAVENAIFAPLLSNNAKNLYLTLWLLAPLAFFTLSRNVLWTYVLPCALPFSVLLARWICDSNNALKRYIWIVPFVIMTGFCAFMLTPSAKNLLAPYHHKDIFSHFSGNGEMAYIGLNPSYSAQFYTHAKYDNLHNLRATNTPLREKIYLLQDLKICGSNATCEIFTPNNLTIAMKSSDFEAHRELFTRFNFKVVIESKGITLLQKNT